MANQNNSIVPLDAAGRTQNTDEPEEYFKHRLEEFFGPLLAVQLPADRLYTRSHTWVQENSPTLSTIGIDHVGAYYLQPVVSVVLPQTPSRVEANSPCAWLVVREGTLALRTSIAGIAIESNSTLVDHPYLLLDDPYASGWILKIRKPEAKQGRTELFTAEEITPILQKEIGLVKEKFSSAFRKMQPPVGSTLHDGGEPVRTVQEMLGHKKYFEIISRVYSKP